MPASPKWYPDWRGQTAVIIGAGPSAKDADLALFRDRPNVKVIVVNESWKLAPWADVLYAADHAWWRHAKGAKEFHGLKISCDDRVREFDPNIQIVAVESQAADQNLFLTSEPGRIGNARNGGFQATNLAIQFGAKRIALVGLDMNLDRGDHWHGRHRRPLNNPTPALMERWVRFWDRAAADLPRLGVTIVNTSPTSSLTAYPTRTLEELFA